MPKRGYREWTNPANAEVGRTASDILRAHHFCGLNWEGVPDRSFWLWSDAGNGGIQKSEPQSFSSRISHCWKMGVQKFAAKELQYHGQKPTKNPYEHESIRVL